jgi:hypothetical protein
MRKVRITGETSALNPGQRCGYAGHTHGAYRAETTNGVDLSLSDPFNGTHTVSLAPFTGEDPNLFLRIRYVVSLEDGRFNPDYSDAVVLKEFELPSGMPLPGTDETA